MKKNLWFGLCILSAFGISACADAPAPNTDPSETGNTTASDTAPAPDISPSPAQKAKCTESEYVCQMNTLFQCSNGNLNIIKSCPSSQKCNAQTKDCQIETPSNPVDNTDQEPEQTAQCMDRERRCHEDQTSVDRCVQGEWMLETECTGGTVCDPTKGVRCDLVIDRESECQEGTLKCDENGTRILGCVSGRLMTAQTCDTDNLIFCDPDTVSCKEGCKDGSFMCTGDETVLKCQGNKWSETAKCGPGQACNADDGECKDVAKCIENDVICIGEQTAVCRDGDYRDDKFCPDGTTCFNGKCEAIPTICNDGTMCRDSYTLVTCKNNVESVTSCGAKGMLCFDKAGGSVCEEVACNETVCKDSSTLLVCDTVTNTVTSQKCGSGKKCDSKTNSCVTVVCRDGEKRCNNNSIEECRDNSWSVSTDCGTKMCNASTTTCVDVKCRNGDTRCNANGKIETCKNNEFSGAKSCAKSTPICETVSSTEAACVAKICTEGSTQCSGAELQKCTNNRWVTERTCDSAALCNAKSATCKDHECENGAQGCSNSIASTKVCKDYAWEYTLCSTVKENSTCRVSSGKASCEVSVCTDGFSCDGNTLKKCDNNAFILNQNCGSDKICNAGKGICESRVCNEGDYTCNGKTLLKCQSNAWKTFSTCTANETCNAATKQCVVNECSVGQVKCEGASIYRCNNGSWALAETCKAGESCDGSRGVCVSNASCTNNTFKCDNNSLYTCASGQWTLKEACSAGKTCNTDKGVCAECYGNVYECRGQDVYQCNSSLKMVKIQTCSANEYCMYDGHGGGCVPKQVSECTAGTYQCSGQTLQVCSTSGKWTTSRVCDSATEQCDASVKDCKNVAECTYGYKCDGKSLMECKNGSWTTKSTCGADEQCDFNLGVCRQCDTRYNKYTCKGQDLYYCNGSSQWAQEKTCTDDQVCEATQYSGSCVAKTETCTSGAKRCESNKLQKCVSGKWTDEMSCDTIDGLCVAEGTTGSCIQGLSLPTWCNIQSVNDKFDRGYGRVLLPEGVTEEQISAELICGDINQAVSKWYSAPAAVNSGCTNCGHNTEYMSTGLNAPAGTYQCAYRFNLGGSHLICTKDGGAPVVQTSTTKLTADKTLKLVINDPAKDENPSWCWFKHLEVSNGNYGEAYLHVYPGALNGGQIKAELICGFKTSAISNWTVVSQATENVFCNSCGSNNIEFMTKPVKKAIATTKKCAFRIQYNNSDHLCPIQESNGNNIMTVTESSQKVPADYYRPE